MIEQIAKMIAEQFNIDPSTINENTNLQSDLGINSLELAELAFNLEEKYGIEVEDDDIPKLLTVGDVASFIETKKA